MTKERKCMVEIHAVMERLHGKWAGMTGEEVVQDVRDGAETAKRKFGVGLKKQAREKSVVSR